MGKIHNNIRPIKSNCKTNVITDEVMDFMGAIVDINKTLEKSPGKASGHKNTFEEFFLTTLKFFNIRDLLVKKE